MLAPSHKTVVKTAASRLSLFVAMELLTAAARHQQTEPFCPPFCSFAPDLYINVYNAETLYFIEQFNLTGTA